MLVETCRRIIYLLPLNIIMVIVKPLYGLAEAGTHWFATYSNHHKTELSMTTSTFDPCLLITTTGNQNFGVIGIQTDDTLGLSISQFSEIEDDKIVFKSK